MTTAPIIDINVEETQPIVRPMLPWEECGAPFGIAMADDVLSEAECKQVVDWLEEKGQFEPSRIGGIPDAPAGVVHEMRTSTTAAFPFMSYDLPDFITAMNREVYRGIRAYSDAVEYNFYEIESPSVQKYEVGQKYDVHYDYGPGNNRVFSALLYLNKPQAGGNTYFPYLDIEIIPEPGRLVVFPSNYMWKHAALPVTEGIKYAAAYWVRG